MSAVAKINWVNKLLDCTESLGNTGESILDKVSDLLNDYCTTPESVDEVAEYTYLSSSTIRRMMDRTPTENDDDYGPYADTLSRVLLFFGATITWGQVKVKTRFAPGEK